MRLRTNFFSNLLGRSLQHLVTFLFELWASPTSPIRPRRTDDLLHRIEDGQIDPSFVITHTVTLDEGPEMYKVFRDKQDSCVKVVLKP